MTRFYGAQADRQQQADRLVWSEDDLRNVLGEAASTRSVATIRLGADIVIGAPLELQGVSYACIVDGGDRFKIRCAEGWTANYVFGIGNRQVSDLSFRGVTFVTPASQSGVVERLIGADVGGTLERVNFRACRTQFVMTLFSAFGGAITWTDSVIDDVTMVGGNAMLTATIGVATFIRCLYGRVTRRENSGPVVPIAGFELAGSTGNLRYLGSSIDVVSASVAQLSIPDAFETLSGASPTVTSTGTAISLTLDATTSGNIQLPAPSAAGRVLLLRCQANAGTASLSSSSAVRTASGAAWFPIAGDTITLKAEAADALNMGAPQWVEVARSGGRQALALNVTLRNLNTPNPGITPTEADALIQVIIGAGATGTGNIQPGKYDGQQLTLIILSKAGIYSLPNNTAANLRLNGSWPANQYDTITLVWVAFDGNWWEVSRK